MLFPLYDDNVASRTPYVTYGLIAVNFAVMLWLASLSPLDQAREVVERGFIPERMEQLTNPKLVVKIPLEPMFERGEPVPVGLPVPVNDLFPPAKPRVVELPPVPGAILLTTLTAMFLHGGWLHLAGNMWFLWIFGNNVEDRLGSFLYLAFYLVGGLLGTTCHWAYDPHSTIPVIGASGAVATILGGYAVTFPRAKVRTLVFLIVVTIIDIPALVWLGLWFVGELTTAAMAGQDLAVAVWAHIGGFVVGAVVMPILSLGGSHHDKAWEEEIKKHFSYPRSDEP